VRIVGFDPDEIECRRLRCAADVVIDANKLAAGG
jgi:hypothetical protein